MKTHSSNDCEEFQKHFDLLELSSSKLSESERKLIVDHTTTCLGCERWLKDWELITKISSKMPQLEVPEFVLKNIMSAVEATTEVSIKEKTIKADVIWLIAGFGTLLLTSAYLGADSPEGVASWSLSFIIVILINQVLQFRRLGEAVRS